MRAMTRIRGLLGILTVLVAAAGFPQAPAEAQEAASSTSAAPARPALKVSVLVDHLNLPWDLSFTPDGTMLFDQRSGIIRARLPGGTVRTVAADMSDLWASSETGLLGLVVDPGFAANRQFYTCQGYQGGSGTDVRVIKWKMNAAYTAAARVGGPVVSGIGTSSGRHGGCRLRFDRSGLLYVSTGDAAIGTNPQNLGSLNGKVLRVTTAGAAAPGNPFLSSGNAKTRLIYTYGHRNVQGLDLRPGTNEMWSVEQGTYRDDEVNRLVAGKNYGYNPVPKQSGDASYNENVPMTDLSLPNVQAAVYSTGPSTLALSGGTWLSGRQWGSLDGAFVAAALKDTSLRALTISSSGALVAQQSLAELNNTYGRLRSPQLGPDGALYLATGDGDGQDQILRITPEGTFGDPACAGQQPAAPSPVASVTVGGQLLAFVAATDRSVRYRSIDGSAGFSNLGGQVLYGPAAVSWDGTDRLDVFAVGINHAVYHRWRTAGRWSAWENFGLAASSSPAVFSTGVGRLNLFVRGSDGALWTKTFHGSWSAWSRVGGLISGAPTAKGGSEPTVGVRGVHGWLFTVRYDTAGRRTTGFVQSSAAICSPPGLTGSGAWAAVGYTRHDGSVDVRMNGISYPLLGTVTGNPALSPGATPLGFAALVEGVHGRLYIFDARHGVSTATGWRDLGAMP